MIKTYPLSWSAGTYDFALTIPLIFDLQRRCNGDGLGLIFKRLHEETYTINDVLATIYLGLQGGGMELKDAVELVETQCEDRGLLPLVVLAQSIMGITLCGWPEAIDKDNGESEGEVRVETLKSSSN